MTADPSQLAAGSRHWLGSQHNIHQEEKRGNLVVVGQIYSPGPQAILGCLYPNVVWEISIRCEGQMTDAGRYVQEGFISWILENIREVSSVASNFKAMVWMFWNAYFWAHEKSRLWKKLPLTQELKTLMETEASAGDFEWCETW